MIDPTVRNHYAQDELCFEYVVRDFPNTSAKGSHSLNDGEFKSFVQRREYGYGESKYEFSGKSIYSNYGTVLGDVIGIILSYKSNADNQFYEKCNENTFVGDDITYTGSDCNCSLLNKTMGRFYKSYLFPVEIDGVVDYNLSAESKTEYGMTENSDGSSTSKSKYKYKLNSISNSTEGFRIIKRSKESDSGTINFSNLKFDIDSDYSIESIETRNNINNSDYSTKYDGWTIAGYFNILISGTVNGTAVNESINITF